MRTRSSRRIPFPLYLVLGPVLVCGAAPLAAQATQQATQDATGEPKELTIDDYGLWRTIESEAISRDGRWVTYGYAKRETDDTLFVRSLDADVVHRIERASEPAFSDDSHWVAYYVSLPFEEVEKLEEDDETVPRKVELLELATGQKVSWENGASFAFAPESGAALAVKRAKGDEDAEHDGTDLILRHLERGTDALLGSVDEYAFNEGGTHLAYTTDTPDDDGKGLFLVDLATGVHRPLDNGRADYARLTWDEEVGTALAVLRGEEAEGLAQRENVLLAFTGIGQGAGSPPGAGVGQEGSARLEGGAPVRYELDPDSAAGFPEGWVLSEEAELEWSPDLSRVFVGVWQQEPDPETLCTSEERSDSTGGGPPARTSTTGSPPSSAPMSEPGEASGGRDGEGGADGSGSGPGGADEGADGGADDRPRGPGEIIGGTCPEFVADVDIWHVGDTRLQSVQRVREERDRERTFRGVAHLEGSGERRSMRFVQLADSGIASVDIGRDGRWAVGESDTAYVHDWKPEPSDYYRIDVGTGERTLFLEAQLRTLGLSPDGRHFLYWKDGHVWDYRLDEDAHANLTAGAPVDFTDAEYDRTGEKPPYGVAGWSEDGQFVILEHRYDLWLQPLDGSPATTLTGGVGTEREIRFRVVELDEEEAEDGLDLQAPILLSAYGQWTKKAGYYRLEGGELSELVFEDARFGRPLKAEDADRLLYTKETFRTFPDLRVADVDFGGERVVTDANPQQAEYRWGRRILFDYETADGVPLQGTLAIPDGYEEGEPLPMLVHFYEKLSQNLHEYPAPRYRHSPQYAGYVSGGYLVLEPDIHFRTGPSHQQMLESIQLAVEKVVEMGYAAPERVGLHGHSYSGQGSTYIATHSDLFGAIVAGAAATNLVSDFNQLWKSSGTNNQGYNIHGQGRFATNPWDDLDLYMDQSATFNAPDMNTPLLLMHGTEDGSVEWLQAVEFYNALRFHGKDVILLSYPGEGHGLRRYENQKDFQIRMRQFYDHHLRDEPAPRWMTDGRSLIAKENARKAAEAAEAAEEGEKEEGEGGEGGEGGAEGEQGEGGEGG